MVSLMTKECDVVEEHDYPSPAAALNILMEETRTRNRDGQPAKLVPNGRDGDAFYIVSFEGGFPRQALEAIIVS